MRRTFGWKGACNHSLCIHGLSDLGRQLGNSEGFLQEYVRFRDVGTYVAGSQRGDRLFSTVRDVNGVSRMRRW